MLLFLLFTIMIGASLHALRCEGSGLGWASVPGLCMMGGCVDSLGIGAVALSPFEPSIDYPDVPSIRVYPLF